MYSNALYTKYSTQYSRECKVQRAYPTDNRCWYVWENKLICVQEACTFSGLGTYIGLRMLISNILACYRHVPCTNMVVNYQVWHQDKNLQTCLELWQKIDVMFYLHQTKTVDNCMQSSYLSLNWFVPLTPTRMFTTYACYATSFEDVTCSKWHMRNYCWILQLA